MNWLTHFRWLVADHGRFYGPTSGWIPDLTMLSVIPLWWHKHNCQQPGCRRIGHHITVEENGHQFLRCKKHHTRRHDPVAVDS